MPLDLVGLFAPSSSPSSTDRAIWPWGAGSIRGIRSGMVGRKCALERGLVTSKRPPSL